MNNYNYYNLQLGNQYNINNANDFVLNPTNVSDYPSINIYIVMASPTQANTTKYFPYFQQQINQPIPNLYYNTSQYQFPMMPTQQPNSIFYSQFPIQDTIHKKHESHKKKDKKSKKDKKKNLNHKKSEKGKNKGNIIKEFTHKDGQEFNGIFRYLTEKIGNICDNGTISITSSSVHNDFDSSYIPQNLVNYHMDSKYFYAETDDTYFWVCFDFKSMEVEISSYTIKSNHWGTNIGHIKSWVMEISDNGTDWTEIDKHDNDPSLNGRLLVRTFNVRPNKFARFCRFRHTGKYWGGSGAGFHSIEFYGRLKMPESK